MSERKVKAVRTVVPVVVLRFLMLVAGLVLVQLSCRVLVSILLQLVFLLLTPARTQPAALPMTFRICRIWLLVSDLCSGCSSGTVLVIVVLQNRLMLPRKVTLRRLVLRLSSSVPPVATMSVLPCRVILSSLPAGLTFFTILMMTLMLLCPIIVNGLLASSLEGTFGWGPPMLCMVMVMSLSGVFIWVRRLLVELASRWVIRELIALFLSRVICIIELDMSIALYGGYG